MDDHIKLLEKLISALAKYGRHARLVLYPNRSGYITDSSGGIPIEFATLEDLLVKLNIQEKKG